jgi:putative flavoprotein involved in K+ transport
VRFADDSQLDVASVIWATGFRTDHSWIDAAVFDQAGRLGHKRGVTASPGLYFVGLSWQHMRGSALLGWVKDDAAYIAEKVAAVRPSTPTEGAEPTTNLGTSAAATAASTSN